MAIEPKNYNDDNWFQKLFIDEAKAALEAENSGGSGGKFYEVSSVEDLPQNAPDGSLAIVEVVNGSDDSGSDSIVGTWQFNEELTTFEPRVYTLEFYYTTDDVNIQCSILVFKYMYSTKMPHLSYTHTVSVDGASNANAYAYDDALSGTIGWQNEAYKTITITREITDPDFITWLKANATKVEV